MTSSSTGSETSPNPDDSVRTIDDPLPRGFLTDGPGIGGALKVRPEDFLVDEIPAYEPCGEGEHLYLRIQKTSVAHGELISCLSRHFDVPRSAIGYAGMKDKHAVTSQTISIHRHDDPADLEIPHERIAVQWASRHRNKLRRGHHRGNRFSIRVRDVDPTSAVAAHRALQALERTGGAEEAAAEAGEAAASPRSGSVRSSPWGASSWRARVDRSAADPGD